jgi:hypothetical protein
LVAEINGIIVIGNKAKTTTRKCLVVIFILPSHATFFNHMFICLNS